MAFVVSINMKLVVGYVTRKAALDGGALSSKGDMYVDFLLPVIWREASKELANASKLYAGTEGDTSCDCDKLKKENAELKKQLELMKSKRKNKLL